jgi:hypothetical protein
MIKVTNDTVNSFKLIVVYLALAGLLQVVYWVWSSVKMEVIKPLGDIFFKFTFT